MNGLVSRSIPPPSGRFRDAGTESRREKNAMPLRDHFHPPVSKRASWEGFHGLWPGIIVQKLAPRLPLGYVAEPRVHLGKYYETNIYKV
jgi:hypothetical protein